MNDERDAMPRRFLLAQLAEEEAERFEAALLDDPALLAATESVEADLYDQFVRGELTPSERAAFLERFGANLDGIAFSRALVARAQRRSNARWLLPLAASILIAITATLFWRSRPEPAPQTAVKPVPIERRTARPHAPEVAKQTIATLSLALASTRNDVETPRLELSPDIDTVALRVRINAADRFPAYEIQLTTADARLWSGKAQRDPSTAVLTANIPADLFRSGEHEIFVTGIAADGTREILGHESAIVLRPR